MKDPSVNLKRYLKTSSPETKLLISPAFNQIIKKISFLVLQKTQYDFIIGVKTDMIGYRYSYIYAI